MAAEAVGNEYPASDVTITRRSRTSMLCNAIRYILPMREDCFRPQSCQLSGSTLKGIRVYYVAPHQNGILSMDHGSNGKGSKMVRCRARQTFPLDPGENAWPI